MTDKMNTTTPLSRRHLLQRAGGGFGMLAAAALLDRESLAAGALNPFSPKQPMHMGKAKSIIWIFTNGGPSQVDTWDYKPELKKRDGKALDGFDPKTGFFPGSVGPLMASPFEWKQHGQSGTWASEIFPKTAMHVDKMCFIHSCWTGSNNHSPALFMMNTGATRMGYPCVGSWVNYGLGSESDSLPSFVVMSDPLNRGLPKGSAANWGAGFLPSIYQGTWLKPKGAPIENLAAPASLTTKRQRAQLDLLAQLNRNALAESPIESELNARIESFELAYRMQTAAPEAFDVKGEPEHIQKLYGLNEKHCGHFAAQCLTARRMVERVCASSRSTRAAWRTSRAGTGTMTSRGIIAALRWRAINRWRRSSPIWNSVGCWIKRSSSGAVNSVACPFHKKPRSRGVITIRMRSPCGCAAAASKAATTTARATRSASKPPWIKSACMTCMRRSSLPRDWIMSG